MIVAMLTRRLPRVAFIASAVLLVGCAHQLKPDSAAKGLPVNAPPPDITAAMQAPEPAATDETITDEAAKRSLTTRSWQRK